MLLFGLVAPVAGIASAVALMMAALYIMEPFRDSSVLQIYLHNLTIFMFFVLPVALCLEVVVGVPAFHLLKRSGRLTSPAVGAVAGIAGALAAATPFVLIVESLSGNLGLAMLFALFGAVGGVVAGLIVWAGLIVNHTA